MKCGTCWWVPCATTKTRLQPCAERRALAAPCRVQQGEAAAARFSRCTASSCGRLRTLIDAASRFASCSRTRCCSRGGHHGPVIEWRKVSAPPSRRAVGRGDTPHLALCRGRRWCSGFRGARRMEGHGNLWLQSPSWFFTRRSSCWRCSQPSHSATHRRLLEPVPYGARRLGSPGGVLCAPPSHTVPCGKAHSRNPRQLASGCRQLGHARDLRLSGRSSRGSRDSRQPWQQTRQSHRRTCGSRLSCSSRTEWPARVKIHCPMQHYSTGKCRWRSPLGHALPRRWDARRHFHARDPPR